MTMNTRLIIPALIAATCAVAGFSPAANAGGFFGDIVNTFAPGVGTLGDAWSREIRERSSSEGAYNQANQWLSYNNNRAPNTVSSAAARRYECSGRP
jgi:hypothetical protein